MDLKLEKREDSSSTCVYCRGEVEDGDGRLVCPDCEACFHWECYRTLKRCSTPGCEGKPRATAEAKEPVEQNPRGLKIPPKRRRGINTARPGIEAPSLGDGVDAGQLSRMTPTERAVHFAKLGAVLGVVIGAVVGISLGGVIFPRRGFDGFGAMKWSMLFVPGLFAGAGYGYLQGLIGLPMPQPKGGGCLTFGAAGAAAGVGFMLGGWVVALSLAMVTCLIGGRLFGFNVPSKGRY